MTDTRPLGEERINEIEGRAEKATPGEWEYWYSLTVPPRHYIDSIRDGRSRIAEIISKNVNSDADFIAHARIDVLDLCAALREANALLVKVWKLTLDDDEPETYLRQHGYIKDQKEAEDADEGRS